MQRIVISQFQNAVRLISSRDGQTLQRAIGATKTVEECTRVPLRSMQRPTPKFPGNIAMGRKSCQHDDVVLCAYPSPAREASSNACCEERTKNEEKVECGNPFMPNLMSNCPQPEGEWSTESKNMKYTVKFILGVAVFVGTICATKCTIYPYDSPSSTW